jgi:hypothetical protein
MKDVGERGVVSVTVPVFVWKTTKCIIQHYQPSSRELNPASSENKAGMLTAIAEFVKRHAITRYWRIILLRQLHGERPVRPSKDNAEMDLGML